MNRLIKFSGLIALGTALLACDGQKQKIDQRDSVEIVNEINKETFDDTKELEVASFVTEQVASVYAELQLTRLAVKKSKHNEIKAVAKKVAVQQEKTLESLQRFAVQKAITLPTEPRAEDRQKVDALAEENDVDSFNKEWTAEMVNKHEQKIEQYQEHLDRVEDPELKSLLSESLSLLQENLTALKTTKERLTDA